MKLTERENSGKTQRVKGEYSIHQPAPGKSNHLSDDERIGTMHPRDLTDKRFLLPFFKIFFFLCLCCLFCSCDKSINPKQTPKFGPSTSAHVNPDLAQQLLNLTGGVRVKLVWLQAQLIDDDTMNYLPNFNDFLFNAPSSQLVVFDTDEPNGRILDANPSSRSTPLISRDGTKVLWSDYSKKALYIIHWDGTGKKILLQGETYQLLCVQWDHSTSSEWIYVSNVQCFPILSLATGSIIYRYTLNGTALDTTSKEFVSQQNFNTPWTVSGDGKYAGGDIDWPYARIESLPNGQLFQISDTSTITCHAQIAPDTSYHLFYFPQSHFCLKMHKFNSTLESNEYLGQIGLPWDCCCPRWSNHVRYLTGGQPYCGGWFYSYCGNPLPPNPKSIPLGTTGEFYFGKFDTNFTSIQWVRVTDLDIRFRKVVGDSWIADGEGPLKP
jgi:hypothetical protein